MEFSGTGGFSITPSGTTTVTLSKSSGVMGFRGGAFRQIAFTGGATFQALDSLDLGGNTGITIVPPGPAPSCNIGI